MVADKDIEARAEALRSLLRARLGVKGRDLAHAVGRAGRLLPRRVRVQAAVIVSAQFQARNPKLARRLDQAGIAAAYGAVAGHLEAIDAADLRRGRMLGIAGVIAFNLILVAAAFVLWLWWRGYI